MTIDNTSMLLLHQLQLLVQQPCVAQPVMPQPSLTWPDTSSVAGSKAHCALLPFKACLGRPVAEESAGAGTLQA